ncbi:MAG: flagellin [Pseudomonadota bacterium]
MSSILTNTSSMVALQTLKSISMDLAKTQDMISTGKKISTAKDNAAIWSISKVMESDVKGFEAIADSLNLGLSTVTVARNAAESVNEMLLEVKERIVAAQEENVDRTKLQDEVNSLRNQIAGIVNSAQFNGLNLLSNREAAAGSGNTSVLSSLNRASDGSVSAANIDVAKQDLGTAASALDGTAGASFNANVGASNVTLNATQSVSIDIGAEIAADGTDAGYGYALNIFGVDADGSTFAPASYNSGAVAAATANTDMPNMDVKYVARDGDTATDIAQGLFESTKAWMATNQLDSDIFNVTVTGDTLTFTSTVTDGTDTIAVQLSSQDTSVTNTIGGGLEALNNVDVSTAEGAEASLDLIEGFIQKAINGAAAFGTTEKRIEIQSDFTSRLIDSLNSGIGALVDTDMEAASAQLQALQVQQQLGVQALSIANQAPQTILSLFQ